MWTTVCERGRARTRACRLPLTAAGIAAALLLAPPLAAGARAQGFAERLQLRSSAAGSLMLSRDQRGYLDYRSPGALGDLQLEAALLPVLSLQLGAAGGVFFSGSPAGGLLAPMLGVMGRYPAGWFTPYLALDAGAGFTGKLMRPFARGRLGVDFPVTRSLQIGPALGMDVVFQRDGPQFSTDAVYAWLGVSMSFQSSLPRRQHAQRVHAPPVQARVAPPTPPLEPAEHPPAAPSPELANLLDEAVHVERSELLAPVLFDFDSDELDATGIAMLHQVAALLTHQRKDIARLSISAYADARGSDDYNRALSRRRAQRVRAWLVAHGIAAERLEVDAEGAVDFVEAGESEAEHQQNRRVVFRVLSTEAK